MPLTDCAPLLVAESEGLFEKHGVSVRLTAEPGWATIREKMIHGELDGAQCLAGLALALNYGLGCLTHPVIVPLVLSSNGNAITISQEISPEVFESGARLEDFLENQWDRGRSLTLAAVHPFSSHHYLLKSWLTRIGFNRQELINYIFLPPPVLSRNLASGNIDGFCVGEPWNSKAILNGEGWCAATSVELDDGHPEKVLVVSRSVGEARPDEVVALTSALLEACLLCQNEAYHGKIAKLLGSLNAFDMKTRDLGASLQRKTLAPSTTKGSQAPERLHLFHGVQVNPPSKQTANWVVSSLRAAGRCNQSPLKNLDQLFRLDLYKQALNSARLTAQLPHPKTNPTTPDK